MDIVWEMVENAFLLACQPRDKIDYSSWDAAQVDLAVEKVRSSCGNIAYALGWLRKHHPKIFGHSAYKTLQRWWLQALEGDVEPLKKK